MNIFKANNSFSLLAFLIFVLNITIEFNIPEINKLLIIELSNNPGKQGNKKQLNHLSINQYFCNLL